MKSVSTRMLPLLALPNTEMSLIMDLDLNKLNVLQNEGSVRNFLDRCRDLYKVVWTSTTPIKTKAEPERAGWN